MARAIKDLSGNKTVAGSMFLAIRLALSSIMEFRLSLSLDYRAIAETVFQNPKRTCRPSIHLNAPSQPLGSVLNPIEFDWIEFDFGEVHHGVGHVVHVIGKDAQRDVGDGLDNLAICQAGYACLTEVTFADFAALHDDVACEFENSVGFGD